MVRHIDQYYKKAEDDMPHEPFQHVIALHKGPDIAFPDLLKLVPCLPQGWFELAGLSQKDRIEFVRDFWISKLPYHPKLCDFILSFFSSLDDIGIFIVQQKKDFSFRAEMAYNLKDDSGFFRGFVPATEQELSEITKVFPNYILPRDYLSFLQIHNGFRKATDCSGILSSQDVYRCYQSLQDSLSQEDPIMTSLNKPVDPKSLIPFYQSFGMPYWQCFWGEWYPDEEMGNVYLVGEQKEIFVDLEGKSTVETMSFTTFTDWLLFYLERVA